MKTRAFFVLVGLLCVVASIDGFVHGDWEGGLLSGVFALGVPTLYSAATYRGSR